MRAVRNRSLRFFLLMLTGCGVESSPPPRKETFQATTQSAPDVKLAGPPHKKVTLIRTPDGGIQPQAVVQKGVVHLIYFKGDPKHGDVYYVKTQDDGKTFTKPLRVNSRPDSVIAMGNVRGAHLAVTIGGRVHVAWMGSMKTAPNGDHHLAAMLYARLNDAGTEFEPQRNLINNAYGLDGGGSIAAYDKHVYVVWHAPTPGSKGEENRRVWLTISEDEGKTFGKEMPISPADAGACGCCGMRALPARALSSPCSFAAPGTSSSATCTC
jgi:hypothetical protein